jgi:hypothetical protein
MIGILAFGFGLGVLATVIAGEFERRSRKQDRRPVVFVIGDHFDDVSPRMRAAAAASAIKDLN